MIKLWSRSLAMSPMMATTGKAMAVVDGAIVDIVTKVTGTLGTIELRGHPMRQSDRCLWAQRHLEAATLISPTTTTILRDVLRDALTTLDTATTRCKLHLESPRMAAHLAPTRTSSCTSSLQRAGLVAVDLADTPEIDRGATMTGTRMMKTCRNTDRSPRVARVAGIVVPTAAAMRVALPASTAGTAHISARRDECWKTAAPSNPDTPRPRCEVLLRSIRPLESPSLSLPRRES